MKQIFSKVLKCVVFLLILLALMGLVSFGFAPKNNTPEGDIDNVKANGILGEKSDSIDVLIVGDSESYTAVTPMQMWNEQGFTSYICGTSAQKLPFTLQFIERGFRSQSPKVVVLETNEIFRKYSLSDYILSRTENYLPIFSFHDRWKTMKWSELFSKASFTWTDTFKGYRYNTEIQEADTSSYMKYTDAIQEIPSSNLKCLKQIQKICEDNNAKLLLVSIPSTRNWNYKRHNAIQKYAEENGLAYIDMNLMNEEISIDWKKDTRDKGDHLNYYGAVKVSGYLGKYLKEEYKLSDHRNDKEYARWNADYEKYRMSVE